MILEFLLLAMIGPGTRFILTPQKITKLDNIIFFKKSQYSDTEQQTMHDSDLWEQRNKQVRPTHKHSLPREFQDYCMGKKIPNRVQ